MHDTDPFPTPISLPPHDYCCQHDETFETGRQCGGCWTEASLFEWEEFQKEAEAAE